jgi:hypothetical protein
VTLLLVDICGMKDRWRTDGAAGVKEVFARFEELIAKALKDTSVSASGAIQSDAAALVFADTREAVIFGRALFVNAFSGCGKEPKSRIWLRGVVMNSDVSASNLVGNRRLGVASDVVARDLHTDLMAAINVEQAGFKGNRLLIEDACVSKDVEKDLRVELGEKGHLRIFSRLEFSQSAPSDYGVWQDVLWMLPHPLRTWSDWEARDRKMANLLRWTARHDGEFREAASTSVVFHECRAMVLAEGAKAKLPGVPLSSLKAAG